MYRILSKNKKYRQLLIALLITGSAVLVVGCGGDEATEEHNDEALVTRTVDSLHLVSSENGKLKNAVITPLMESHALAKDPFDEYRMGIETLGYDQETGLENFRVTADYALHFTARDLWDLKGNVRVQGEAGRQLFTQQLFWDVKLKKFYSNVDTKVTDGPSQTVGTGFDAADDLTRWTFRQIKGVVYVDTTPTEPTADSIAMVGAPAGDGGSAPESIPAQGDGSVSAPEQAPAGTGEKVRDRELAPVREKEAIEMRGGGGDVPAKAPASAGVQNSVPAEITDGGGSDKLLAPSER